MGSVLSDIECPQCGNPEAVEDLYYKSGEVYVSCNKCGYHYERIIKRDKERHPILKCPECDKEDSATKAGKCKKCGFDFTENDTIKYLVYDITEERGKGSLTYAGVLFTCPECNENTCPTKKRGVYYCKHCNKPFDEATTEKMLKRKKQSFVMTVQMLPESMSDAEVKKTIEDIKKERDVVLVDDNIYEED
jgi:ribosomal protein L37AE/L43A